MVGARRPTASANSAVESVGRTVNLLSIGYVKIASLISGGMLLDRISLARYASVAGVAGAWFDASASDHQAHGTVRLGSAWR